MTVISDVGYVSFGLTLLLTTLPPAIHGYQYLIARSLTIKLEVKYPCKDAVKLSNKVTTIEVRIKTIEDLLDI